MPAGSMIGAAKMPQQATSLFDWGAFVFHDFGVNKDAKGFVVFVVKIVADDHNAIEFGDLDRG